MSTYKDGITNADYEFQTNKAQAVAQVIKVIDFRIRGKTWSWRQIGIRFDAPKQYKDWMWPHIMEYYTKRGWFITKYEREDCLYNRYCSIELINESLRKKRMNTCMILLLCGIFVLTCIVSGNLFALFIYIIER